MSEELQHVSIICQFCQKLLYGKANINAHKYICMEQIRNTLEKEMNISQGKNQKRRAKKFIQKVLNEGLSNFQKYSAKFKVKQEQKNQNQQLQDQSEKQAEKKPPAEQLQKRLEFNQACNSDQNELACKSKNLNEDYVLLKKVNRMVVKWNCQKCSKDFCREQDGYRHFQQQHQDLNETEQKCLDLKKKKKQLNSSRVEQPE